MKGNAFITTGIPLLLCAAVSGYTLQWDVNSSNFLDYFVFDTVSILVLLY